jgi:hypothetical protein
LLKKLLINFKRKLKRTNISTLIATTILETPSDNSEFMILKSNTLNKKDSEKNGDAPTRFFSNSLKDKSQKTKLMKKKSLPMKSVMKKLLN